MRKKEKKREWKSIGDYYQCFFGINSMTKTDNKNVKVLKTWKIGKNSV